MKKTMAAVICSVPFVAMSAAQAQTAPADPGASSQAPVATTDNQARTAGTVQGWSVKDRIMGKSVYNENDEKVGDISDVILARDAKATYVIIGVGGFLGMGERNVALPFDDLSEQDGRLRLTGYTKDRLKQLPEYKS